MKKKFNMKYVFSIMLAIVVLLGFGPKVNADNYPDKITFTLSKKLDNYSGVLLKKKGSIGSYGTTYKKAKFDNNTEVYAFCFNHELNAPNVGTVLKRTELSAIEQQRKNAFIYILENGLGGNWSLGGNFTEEEKYYITQLAIWGVQNNDGGGVDLDAVPAQTDQKRINILDAAKRLRDAAMAHNTVAPNSLSVTTTKTQLSPTADKKYYRTADISVTGNGFKNYKITLTNAPTGTEIVESNTSNVKKSGDSLAAGKKFYVRVPTDKTSSSLNLKVTVSVTASSKDLVKYKDSNANKQDIGVPFTKPEALSKALTFTAAPTGSLQVKKVEVLADGTEKSLKDVKITVLNSDKKTVLTWTTTADADNTKKIDNLPVGTYTVVEESAPEGYTKSNNVTVKVEPLKTVTVTLKNVKDRQPVYISKQDATTGAELPGAKLILKNALGKTIEEWVSTTEPHLISTQLTPGKYILTEIAAPEGYQKTEETVSFMVNEYGNVDTKVVMKNTPKTSVKISKQDITTGKELPGAKLTVKNSKGEVVDEWVSTTEPHYLPDNLPAGDYKLIEVTSPEGYGLSEEVIDFTITSDGVEKTITMTNSQVPVTADMPVVTIVAILIVTSLIAGVGIFKLNKQES